MIDPNHVLSVGAATDLYVEQLQARVALISQERNGYMEAADRACDERDEFKAKVAELEKDLLKTKMDLLTSYGESEELSGRIAELEAEVERTNDAFEQEHKACHDLIAKVIPNINKQLLSAQAENARLRTVPMKYRRMAFNAQLQDENNELRAQLAALTKQRDMAVEAIRHCIAAMGSVTDVKKAMDWPQLHNAQMLSLQALDAIKESEVK